MYLSLAGVHVLVYLLVDHRVVYYFISEFSIAKYLSYVIHTDKSKAMCALMNAFQSAALASVFLVIDSVETSTLWFSAP